MPFLIISYVAGDSQNRNFIILCDIVSITYDNKVELNCTIYMLHSLTIVQRTVNLSGHSE